MYFIGFGVGAVFFKMPDSCGRKSTMFWMLPAFAAADALTVFSTEMTWKAVGYFLKGVCHIK